MKLKRVLAWIIEVLMEASLLMAVGAVLAFRFDSVKLTEISIKEMFVIWAAYFAGMTVSGYTLTTLALRALVPANNVWTYSAGACLLFNFHISVLNSMIINGELGDFKSRCLLRVFGTASVFASSLVTSLWLRRRDTEELAATS